MQASRELLDDGCCVRVEYFLAAQDRETAIQLGDGSDDSGETPDILKATALLLIRHFSNTRRQSIG